MYLSTSRSIAAGAIVALLMAVTSPASAQQDEWQSVGHGEAFPIGKVNPLAGWIANPVDAERWQPTVQPNLAAELAAAPKLELERVAPAPERCWSSSQPYLVPASDGASWQMIFPYFNGYGREQEVVMYDFATGEMKRQYFNQPRAELARDTRVDFHMQPGYYAHGKFIIEMGGPVAFLIYDPAEGRFVQGIKPFGNNVIQGRAVLGEDDMIYGMGWERGGGFVAYQLDPRTHDVKRYDTFGPANPHRQELYRSVTMQGDWIYAALGNRPWHLVALNVKTGEGRVLATTQDIRGSGRTINLILMEGGIMGHVQEAVEIRGHEAFNREQFDFWLHEGEVHARTGDVPPWSDAPAVRSSRQVQWGRGPNSWSGVKTATSAPQIEAKAPAVGGAVELRYRLAGGDWQTLEYNVEMYPGEVARLTELNEDVLFTTDSGYGEHVFYNVRTKQLKRIEGSVSTYAVGVAGEKLYVTGYPSAPVYEYNLDRPLGRQQEVPNPQRVAQVGQNQRIHYPMAGLLAGADGRVYTAGDSSGRQRVGGGVGWYDTNTGESGGEDIDGHRFFWGATANEGRYILMASKHDDRGQLFIYDTQERAYRAPMALPFARHPGSIVEAMPGLVIGYTDAEDGEGGILYGLRPETGEVVWRKDVPAGPVTSFSEVRRSRFTFRRGPDGYVWAFIGKTLVRIDPRNANIEPVGQVDQPAQIAFTADGVYLAGSSALQRIRNVSASSR